MADSIGVTPGTGRNIAVDAGVTMPDSSSADVQFVELYRNILFTPWQAPTVTTGSAYTAGDVIGGVMTFANAARRSGGGGLIRNYQVIDESGTIGNYDLFIFSDTIGAVTDKATWSAASADLQKIVYHKPTQSSFPAGALKYFSDLGYDWGTVEVPYICAATSLYGLIVAESGPTFTGTTQLKVRLVLQRD